MAEQQAMHAGEAVAEALRAEGVERIYSVPGSHIHPIYDGISRIKPMQFVTCKMEPNTSLMADAYGRLTGKPGVCLVTAGPGGVNSMAGVAQERCPAPRPPAEGYAALLALRPRLDAAAAAKDVKAQLAAVVEIRKVGLGAEAQAAARDLVADLRRPGVVRAHQHVRAQQLGGVALQRLLHPVR